MMAQSASPSGAQLPGADEKSRDLLDRPLGRGQSDARQPAPGERLQPLERQREVQAALAAHHRVNLIDDDAAHAREHGAPGLRAEEDVERLRRRDHDVRRPPAHALPLVLRRIAGAHEGADLDIGQPHRAQLVADARQRRLEIAADVVGERLERRDVEDVGLVLQSAALQTLAAPAGRWRRGTRRVSCPSRWARRSAYGGPPGSPATLAPAPAWAPRRRARASG